MPNQLYIHSEDREILRDLFASSEPVDIYVFHEKYLLAPGQIARFLRKYTMTGVVDFDSNTVYLTDQGKQWIIKNRRIIFGNIQFRPWNNIPEDFRCAKIPINEPYLPRGKKWASYNKLN